MFLLINILGQTLVDLGLAEFVVEHIIIPLDKILFVLGVI